MTAHPLCPRCGSTDVLRIVYGYPTSDALEAMERGEIALRGCLIGEESPAYECGSCLASLPCVKVHDGD
jgi:hypothetical protein